MTDITLKRFQQWRKDHFELATTVCQCKAAAELATQQATAYLTPILLSYRLTDGRGATIRDLARVGECSDEVLRNQFLAAAERAHRERGWSGPSGSSPLL